MAETYEAILQRMRDKFLALSGYNADDASDIGLRLRVLAGEVFSLRTAVDWLGRQAFLQTAEGESLDLRAKERGVTRKQAAKASGVLEFFRQEATWFHISVPKGTVCATEQNEGVRFVTTEDTVLYAGSLKVTAPAEAEAGGTDGNAAVGAVSVLVTAPSGIQGVRNTSAFTGGLDGEDDASLRAHLMEACASLSNGSNAAFYRDCALRHSGVFSVGVIPRENGAGTVGLYLGARGDVPGAEVVREVQAELDSLRELNVEVHVAAAQKAACNASLVLVLPDGGNREQAKAAARTAVNQYMKNLRVGEPFVPNALCARIFETGLVADCLLSGVVRPSISQKQLAMEGTIAIS